MSESGAPRDEPTVLGAGTGSPDLACTDDVCALAWTNNCDGPECPRWLNITRFSDSGERIGETVQIGSGRTSALEPRIVWTGDGFGLAWIVRRSDDRQLRFLVLDEEGNAEGEPLVVSTGELFPRHSELLWTGESFVLAYTNETDHDIEVHIARLDEGGALSGTPGAVTSGSGASQQPALVLMDSELGLAWENDGEHASRFEIYFARLDSDLAIQGEPNRISDSVGTAGAPDLVWTGTDVAATWLERQEDRESIYFTRIAPDGTLAEDPIWLDSASGYATAPSMVTTEVGFTIAWGNDSLDMFEARGLYLSRVCDF